MILTGRDSYGFGVHKYMEKTVIPEKYPTLPGLLSQAGYQTQAIGKMHFFPQRCCYGFANMVLCEEGRRFEGMKRDDYEWELEDRGYRGMIWAHGIANNQAAARIWHLPEELHSTNWIARKGCEFLERRDPRRPFFLWLSFTKPHPPYVPPLAYWEMYSNRKLSVPARGTWLENPPIPTCIMDSWITRNVDLVDEQERENVQRAYYGLITQIDHQIGFFLGDLREHDLLENTLIVYFSDHGDMMWDHGAMFKAMFYEGAARVPLIIKPHKDFKWSQYGWNPGWISRNPVALYDIMPTLLEICGVDIPVGLEAISMFSGIKRKYVFGDYDGDHFVTDGRYKYFWHKSGGIEQLFDLENDPKEESNLIDSLDPKPWRQCLIEFLGGKDPIVQNGRLVATQHPGVSFSREINMWHPRGAHF